MGDFMTNVFNCLERANGNDVKEGLCPMRYASAAFDALSATDNELGINNGEMGLTGKHTFWTDLFGSGNSGSSSSSSSSPFGNLFGSSGTKSSSSNIFSNLFGDASS